MATTATAKKSEVTGVQSHYLRQFAILWTVGMLVYMGMGLTSPQYSIRIIEQGISLRDFGIIQGLATLFSISTQVYIGKLSDRLGKRKPMFVGAILIMIPIALLFPHAKSGWMFFVLLAINQMVAGLFNAISANWVTRFGIPGQLGRLHGFFRISFSVGWIIATMFMGFILDSLGFVRLFYVASTFFIAALTLAIIGTTEKSQLMHPDRPTENHTQDVIQKPFQWSMELKLLLLALGVFTLAQTMGMNFNYIFLKEEMVVTNRQFGLLTSIQSWPEIPLMLLLGIMTDKIPSAILLVLGMGLSSLRWLFMSIVQSTSHLYFIQPLHATGMTVTEVVVVAVIAKITPPEHLGTVMGWQVTVVNFARFLAPLLAGLIASLMGLRMTFLVSFMIALLGALLVLWTSKTKRR
jgi:MFS family permease